MNTEINKLLLAFKKESARKKDYLVEPIRIFMQYKETSEGRGWLLKTTGKQDKEEQIKDIFGISSHAAKCYLKLLQPQNQKYLDLFLGKHSLSEAYSECIK